MNAKRIYEDTTQPEGLYYAEDHGANVAGVFFLGKRCKKAKYIATSRVNDVEAIKRRIAEHVTPQQAERIEQSFRRVAHGVLISMSSLGKIFAAGKVALRAGANDAQLDNVVRNAVSQLGT